MRTFDKCARASVLGAFILLSAFAQSSAHALNWSPTGPALTAGSVGQAYSQTISLTGTGTGNRPYAFVIATGSALPPGLSLAGASDVSCTISGTPTAAGAYTFTVQATDAKGKVDANPYSITVNKGTSTVSLGSSANPSKFGQTVTFTATVNTFVLATGSVTFKDGATTLGSGTVDGTGHATFALSSLSLGSHSVTAVYGGDANFLSSTSPILTQTVTQAATTTALSSSLNPSLQGQAVTFTATVGASSPGSGTPTGTVVFKDGATTLSTTTLASGSATFTTSTLANAGHSITAAYSGDANFIASTSTTLTQTVNQAPAITSGNSTIFTVGSAGSFTATATGSPAPTFSVSSGTLPAGVSLAASGVLSGTPASGMGGVYAVTIKASNGIGTDATQNFTLTINQAPALTSANGTTFTTGAAGSFTATATGFPAPTFSRLGGTLPSGIAFSSAGVLSGTPAAGTGGTYPITISAANGVGSNATQSFTLTVNQQPAITSLSSANFVVGTAGLFTTTATGFPAPTFAVSAGALPNGLSLSSAGVLSGNAAHNTGGSYSLTITASNGVSPAAQQAFTLTVNEAPAITSAGNATFEVGTQSSFTVTTGHAFPAIGLSESGTLPGGVTFVDNGDGTATLAGNPVTGSGGMYSFSFTASNGIAPDAVQPFSLTVNEASSIISDSTTTFTVGIAGDFTVVTGHDFPELTLISTPGPLPDAVKFKDNNDGTTATLAGTPVVGTGGAYGFAITATNGISPDAIQHFTLNVNEAPSFTTGPANQTVTVGDTASFGPVAATGVPPPVFKWQRLVNGSWADIVGGSGKSFSIVAAFPDDYGAQFRAVATNVAGSANGAVATLTVKRNQSITFGPLNNMHYGDGDLALMAVASSGLAVSYASSDPNVATIVDGKIHVVAPGITSITASQPGDNDNWNAAADVAQTLTVEKAVLTVTADSVSRNYGEQNPQFTATITGYVKGENSATAAVTGAPDLSTTATASSGAGTYTITASIGSLLAANYSFVPVNGLLTIQAVPLKITADDKSKAYGAALPQLTASYSGFVNGDDASKLTAQPTLSTTATASSDAGSYPITVSGASSPNYTISYVNGTLTIQAVALTITADDKIKAYGAALPKFTASYSGFVNNDDASKLTTPPTLATTATAASNVGSYPITASGAASP
ncbi:MAG TPA: MBG domain-containing protein, partial [Planctomycetota bacterium]